MAESADKSQVKIKLITKEQDESLQVSDSALYVPISLKRYGLSEIVNYLLVQQNKRDESDKAVPFDFLINDTLLNTSLEQYLVKNALSNEVLLTLEYKKSVLPPLFLSSFNNDDWVSAISVVHDENILKGNAYEPRILTGSYDGIVRTWDMSGKIQKQLSGHSAPIRAVKWISETRMVSAGNDRQVRLWKVKNTSGNPDKDDVDEDADLEEDDDKPEEGKTIAILEGHKAPVVSLDVNLKESRILSASYDNSIAVWSTNQKDMDPITYEHDRLSNNLTSTAAKKRRKLAIADESIKRRSPLMKMESHRQPVESVIFSKLDSTVGYSVSQDHSIKTWDLITGRNVNTSTTGYSLLSALEMPSLNVLVAGSSARHIILHDPRIDATSIVSKQLIGHKNFVVDLAKDPINDYTFASASHDGSVKVWDIRSDKSIYSLTREQNSTGGHEKVLAVDWHEKVGIVSGGEDKKIQINKGTDITN